MHWGGVRVNSIGHSRVGVRREAKAKDRVGVCHGWGENVRWRVIGLDGSIDQGEGVR